MKLELYKAYRTIAGHKAVVVDKYDQGGISPNLISPYLVYHTKDSKARHHTEDGKSLADLVKLGRDKDHSDIGLNLISEWQDPRKGVLWVHVYDTWSSCHNDKYSAEFAYHDLRKDGHTRLALKKVIWTEGD